MAEATGHGDSRLVVGSAALLLVLYLLTATWSAPYTPDAYTNAIQARTWAADASPVVDEAAGLEQPDYQGTVAWFVASPDGPTAQYPPGAAWWGALFYLADTSLEMQSATWENVETGRSGVLDVPVPAFGPAAVAAAVSVTVAMLFLGLTLRSIMSARDAVVATSVAALGTGAWSVAADKLWQHGPAMMCISVGTFLTSRNRFWGAGLAFAGALLVRPHTAIIAAALGLTVAVRRRSIVPALQLGSTAAIGLAGLIAYNDWVFGEPSISGGYGSTFGDRVAGSDPIAWLGRVIAAFVDPSVGMVWTSSFLVVCLLGVRHVRRDAPDWAVGAAIGGALYLLVQLKANRVSGGFGFFSYRYPLEALMAAAPILASAAIAWVRAQPSRHRILTLLCGASIIIHGYGAVFLSNTNL